jgi:superfamily I DNA and/or RNA helicase
MVIPMVISIFVGFATRNNTNLNAIAKLKDDIIQEINSVNSKTKKQKTIIDHYEFQKQIGNYYFYKIWIVDDIKLQEDETIKIKSANSVQNIEAVIITVHETEEFTIRTTVKLVKEIYYLNRTFDPTFILKSLNEALSKDSTNRHFCQKIFNSLQSNEQLNINDKSALIQQLNPSQEKAIKLSEEKEITLIWGPPGTGKTYTLAEIIYRAFRRHESVLVLSTSNVAIDQVLLYLDQILSSQHKGSILRLGATDNKTCFQYIKPNSALEISEQIVFSTLATASLKHEKLLTKKFDLVIVDEASMVSFPYAIFASLIATRNIVFAGDFQQLPPISLCENTSLSINIFDYLRIPKLLEEKSHQISHLALLDTQYRMSPQISNLVSSLFYKNQLKCGVNNSHLNKIKQLEFIDIDRTSNYCNSYYSVEYESYYNPITVALLEQIKSLYNEEKEILFITPYRAQQHLLSYYMIDQEKKNYRALTVHKAQGSEADLVIFDLTTHTKTNKSEYAKILTSNATKNLINVAISRAKSKLIMIGSLQMIKALSNSNLLWKHLYSKIQTDFLVTPLSSFLENLPQFQVKLGNEKVILGIFNSDSNNNQLLRIFIQSKAEQKFYFSNQEHSPQAGITFRKINHNNFPDLITWGEKIAFIKHNNYFSVTSPMTAQVLRRVIVGHLIDDTPPDPFPLLCEKCGKNKIVVHYSYKGGYYLECQQCQQQTLITKTIADKIKSIYKIKCPDCFADMIPRQKKNERFYSFYGCSNYPHCKGLVSFNQFSFKKK